MLCISLADSVDGSLGSYRTVIEVAIWVAALPLMAIGGFFAMRVLGFQSSVIWLASGALIGSLAYQGFGTPNLWKYVLAYPVSLLLLHASSKGLTRLAPLAASVALLLISVGNDSRSVGGAVALTAVFVVLFGHQASWDARAHQPAGEHLLPSRVPPTQMFGRLLTLSIAAVGGLAILLQAMKRGWLGPTLARQYAEQTADGQNILLGGRVEWNVTATLFQARPFGFGLGTSPNLSLQGDAIRAVALAGGDANRTYYDIAVFGERVDVHSIVGNLWFHAGPGGVLLVAVALSLLVLGLVSTTLITDWRPGTRAVAYFAIGQAGWDLLFSPMAQVDRVAIGLAVALAAVYTRRIAAAERAARTMAA
jgi:hypothetical protein